MNNRKNRHFLVTGGTGFLGAALVNRLVARGDKVTVFDNNWRGSTGRLSAVIDSVNFIEGDIRDVESVTRACEGVDSVIHMAFVNGTRFFYEQPELVLDVGIRGMLNVIGACRAQGVRDLVVASSSEVYQTPPDVPTDESAPMSIPDPRNPRYSYAGGKILSELIAFNYGKTGFDRVCVFRPHNVYGPDMGWEHVIPEFSVRASRAVESHSDGPVEFVIQGSGAQTRAFIHVDDFTDGLLVIVDKGEHMGLYHIGNPEEISIGDLAKMVVGCFGQDAEIKFSDEPGGATQRRCPDITKLRSLGFEPLTPLEKGLPSVVDWYAEHRSQAPSS
ncbi:NAD-dependent epimerase/dehydratase family protein [Candidatus Lucifugimonas marina]|uniref:NAD-dependent epimerase/dehydratase family protein n=1 Tax=Candidatus Lucifugimonas marina TaxID=3038979 RepID=A0AAJ6CRY7_9CHLR|nr:NAD-dependent epimerase/dehydratase family protein [SAR202 cluster bacterium JH702]MDG0868263.1 NAD-dependent epimerase/dehydratase family protein [SAR202 cluster bacterium JH639]WFG34907.1 NAD-dependent epimerase/dehydratase family protein [SAR202 cluster bacterium JH545]WFG38858.1 NAD-dependent epimerase/dehydratase family protein [SAR202 cluster bacterium JH1073]